MKVVIAGGARRRGARGASWPKRHAVTKIIERDRQVCEQIFASKVGAVTVLGDATDARSLDAAGVASRRRRRHARARCRPTTSPSRCSAAAAARASDGADARRPLPRRLPPRRRPRAHRRGRRRRVEDRLVDQFPDVGGIIPLPAGDMILFRLPIARAWWQARRWRRTRADRDFPRLLFIAWSTPRGGTELPPRDGDPANHTAILVARRDAVEQRRAASPAEPTADGESVASVTSALRRIDFLAPLDDQARRGWPATSTSCASPRGRWSSSAATRLSPSPRALGRWRSSPRAAWWRR